MTARPLSAPLRARLDVCNICRDSTQSPRRAFVAVTRAFGKASTPNRSNTAPHALLPQSQRRTAVPSSNPVNLQYVPRARTFATESPAASSASSGVAPLPHRRLISISGADAAKFLQGLVTNKVDPDRTSPFYAAFLDARGRVLWDVFIWVWPGLVKERGHWACYIEVDEGEVEALKKHLKRHKLRSKVQIEDVADYKVWAAWGNAAKEINMSTVDAVLQDPRAPQESLLRVLTSANCETIAANEADPQDVSEYNLLRYTYGISEGPNEIPRESALPMECNIDLSSGIDFKKGCYVGQELTIRTKHTGVVRKRMLPVHLYDSDASEPLPQSGTDIKQLDEDGKIKKGRAAGKYIAGIGNVGLALCRLEMMTSMKVSAEGGSWKPGMEFGIETDSGVVKVKPVLHDWFVLRERTLWDKNRTRI